MSIFRLGLSCLRKKTDILEQFRKNMVRTRKKSQMSESEDEVATVTARRSSRRSSRSTTKVLYEEDDIDPEALQGSFTFAN